GAKAIHGLGWKRDEFARAQRSGRGVYRLAVDGHERHFCNRRRGALSGWHPFGLICPLRQGAPRAPQASSLREISMTYQAPVDDMLFALNSAAGLSELIASGVLDGIDEETVRAILAEAGKFAAEVLDPLSAPGDRAGSSLVDGKVVTPPGWREAYQRFTDG